MTPWSDKAPSSDGRGRLRAILAGEPCLFPASVFDPLSARIARDLGHEAAMLAGSVASLTVLGAPDLILLTLSELAEQARRITRACDIALMCDADHGYGNALNVMRTVAELEAAGVAGLSIEDTWLPTAHEAAGAPALVPLGEGVGKMRAALAARTDPDLVIAARSSAAALVSVDEAIGRARAYQETGVDAIFLVGLKSRAELERIAAHIRLPIILGGVAPDLLEADWLAAHGVRLAIRGHEPVAAAYLAYHRALQALREGAASVGDAGDGDEADTARALLRRATREQHYAAWRADFMGKP